MSIFDDVNNWQRAEGAELFLSMLNVPEPVILDYGCGAGTYSFAAAYAFLIKSISTSAIMFIFSLKSVK